MIYKEFSKETEETIKTLKTLLRDSNSEAQKKLIQADLKKIENGYIAEKENSYHLDFHLGDSKNHILLHNIRLENNGKTAQIDHMLINRMGITLLESKSFKGILEIREDGSLSVNYGKYIKTFPNPIEQNNRHKIVVESLINDFFDLPLNVKALGGMKFYTKVLIDPRTSIKNKKLTDGYERSDRYATSRLEEIDKMNPLTVLKTAATMLTIDTAKELAKFLLKQNKPLTFDYTQKYRIKTNSSFIAEKSVNYEKKNEVSRDIQQTLFSCNKCKSTNLEVWYGRNYYFKCPDCENNIPIKHTCKTSSCKPRTKKRKLQFFKICEACGIDELFYENKS